MCIILNSFSSPWKEKDESWREKKTTLPFLCKVAVVFGFGTTYSLIDEHQGSLVLAWLSKIIYLAAMIYQDEDLM